VKDDGIVRHAREADWLGSSENEEPIVWTSYVGRYDADSELS
jgi:hypothetical protein